MMKWTAAILLAAAIGCGGAGNAQKPTMVAEEPTVNDGKTVVKTDQEWKAQLSPLAYRVTREGGTERAFTGEYWDFKGDGVYLCVGCGAELFDSMTKYESGTGWPSYTTPVADESVKKTVEPGYEGREIYEVSCAHCGSHLGHVFPDGPAPLGTRYCMNSVALTFAERGVVSTPDEDD